MKRQTRESGFSLVTILAIGIVASLWLTALAAFVMPSYKKTSQVRQYNILRSSTEAALDWGVAQLNSALSGGSSSVADDSLSDGIATTTSVPSSVLSNSNATGTISINNVAAPNTSYVYDPLLDPTNAQGVVPTNGWRIVTSSVTIGDKTKTIRVILKPAYQTSAGNPTPTPYFQYGVFGRGNIAMSGNAYTDGYSSSLGSYGGSNINNIAGDIGSNTSMTLSGNANVGGTVEILSTPVGSSTVVTSGSGNSQIKEYLKVNGSQNGFTSDNSGNTKVGTALDPSEQANAIQIQLTSDQLNLPAAPPAPDGAINKGAINISGNKTMNLAPGDYIASSISITGNASLNLVADASGNYGPVNIYLQGTSASIAISGNGILNNSNLPQNLRIWFSGSGNTSISGNGNFKGVIYAPNSNVSITGNGAQYGAIVGNNITMSGNGGFHYDTVLGLSSTGLTYNQTSTTQSLYKMQTVSWQEL